MAKGVAWVLACLALAGCGSREDRRDVLAGATAPCPFVGIVADAADVTRFRGPGADLSVMVVDARIAGFDLRCDWGARRESLDVSVTPRFRIERGPRFEGRNVELPWILAITDATQTEVLADQRFVFRAAFPPNVARLEAAPRPVTVSLPGRDAAATRQLLIAFALTPEELALNRRRGAR
jgi:hypothetical protein